MPNVLMYFFVFFVYFHFEFSPFLFSFKSDGILLSDIFVALISMSVSAQLNFDDLKINCVLSPIICPTGNNY